MLLRTITLFKSNRDSSKSSARLDRGEHPVKIAHFIAWFCLGENGPKQSAFLNYHKPEEEKTREKGTPMQSDWQRFTIPRLMIDTRVVIMTHTWIDNHNQNEILIVVSFHFMPTSREEKQTVPKAEKPDFLPIPTDK